MKKIPRSAVLLWVIAVLVLVAGVSLAFEGNIASMLAGIAIAGILGFLGFRKYKIGDKPKNRKPNITITGTEMRIRDESGVNIVGKSFAEHDLPMLLKQLGETKYIVETSKNADTVKGRLDFGLERAFKLKEYEGLGIYTGLPSAAEYIEFFKQAPESVMPPPKHYDTMEGLEFEHFCADLLRKNGFENVEVSKGSGDHGVDILAEKDGVTYAIQCKRSASNIGNKAVQEIYSGRSFHRRHIGAVLTNQHFTTNAQEAAAQTGILLWDREQLEKMIQNEVVI